MGRCEAKCLRFNQNLNLRGKITWFESKNRVFLVDSSDNES